MRLRAGRSGEIASIPAFISGSDSGTDVGSGRALEIFSKAGSDTNINSSYATIGKRLLDVGLVLLTLPISLLIIAIAAFALWIEGGTPFYRQKRLGKDGKEFTMFKLRTMVRDADTRLASILAEDAALNREWHFTQKLKNDPRITVVGDFLRRSSIDELPQLWNVLKGDMSLIGPRPMMPDQLPLYGDPKAYFALRPGLSGFWQVSDRNESSFGFRADADRSYAYRISFRVDLFVLWKTVGAVLNRTGY